MSASASRRDSTDCSLARSATGVWTFRGRISGRCAKCRQSDRRGGIQKIKEAKQLGAMTHHVNGGKPGRQARSRAQRSIGVSPVFPIGVQGGDQKIAGRTSPRSHSPICSRHSATQAGRLCFYEADVVKTRGEYCFLFIFLHFNCVIRQQLTL